MSSKDKRVSDKQFKKFVDAVDLAESLKNDVILSTGNLNLSNLTASDHKKHAALYFSFKSKPKIPFNKKTNNGQAKSQIEYYDRCQEFVEKYISHHMTNGTVISVEVLNLQKRPYNVLPDTFKSAAVVPHGSIVVDVPSSLWSKDNFDKLCSETIIEGFVVVDNGTGDRYKLKNENFHSSTNPEKKRDNHNKLPDKYTDIGLKLCGGNYSYDSAALYSVINNLSQEEIIANIDINNVTVNMKVIPIKHVIAKQLANPFDGDKMMNFYRTVGQGPTYRYTDELYNPNILDKSLEFQLKFDGETALVYKDNTGLTHLMVKVQVDVYEIEKNNGSKVWRLGWL